MKYLRTAVIILFGMHWQMAGAQDGGPSPEELDAAYTEADAAREAAGWSDQPASRRASGDPLGDIVARANLIFQGIVESQSVSYDANGAPFTHTTFSVSDVLKGKFGSGKFTLVQEGGADKDDKNIVAISSASRHFSVGEEELLFLDLRTDRGRQAAERASGRESATYSNTRASSPVVQFRFRIYGGQMYDEDGRGVTVEPTASGHRLVISSDRNPAPRFSQIQVGSHTLSVYFSEDEEVVTDGTEEGRSSARAVTSSYRDSSDVATLSAAITN